jgi:pyridoxine 5-phosphate synthase
MRKKLGVNIDHVATVRQARRRHIQDRDVEILKQVVQTRINLEMAATDEMVGIAKAIRPFSSTIVPEKREEVTTEGGLDVLSQRESLHETVSRLQEAGIFVSLFIDPDLGQVRAAKQAGADAVEIHTGTYCVAFQAGTFAREFEKFAGHGLDLRNIVPILSLPEIEEFNIGHSIIARAMFVGLGQAVREMADLIHGA